MNTALASLLADWVHHWDDETPDSEKRLDILEAKQHLQGLVRLLLDEDLVVRIAQRLYAHEAQGHFVWAEVSAAERNNMVIRARDVLDALKDEIMEDRPATSVEEMELDRILDKGEDMGKIKCSWCGHEIVLAPLGVQASWIRTDLEKPDIRCELSPTDLHDPN